jgi:hypothetical protein
MKHLKSSNKPYIIVAIIAALMFLGTVSSFAEVQRSGNTFKVESTTSVSNDTQTKYTWQDKEGKEYPIFITKKGACYVKRVSKKTGKEYKYYLPKDVQETIRKELNIQ